MSSDDYAVRREVAVKRCLYLIDWYEVNRSRSRNYYFALEAITVIFGGLTPILILWTDLAKPVQALPAVLSSIAAALNGIFHPREGWASRSYAGESLKAELTKFETRTGSKYGVGVDENQALTNFVDSVADISLSEASQWRDLMVRPKRAISPDSE